MCGGTNYYIEALLFDNSHEKKTKDGSDAPFNEQAFLENFDRMTQGLDDKF